MYSSYYGGLAGTGAGLAAGSFITVLLSIAAFVVSIVLYHRFASSASESISDFKRSWSWHRFFSFDKMMIAGIVKYLYILSALEIAAFAIGTFIGSLFTGSAGVMFIGLLTGILIFALGELLCRVAFEFMMLSIKLTENSSVIKEAVAGTGNGGFGGFGGPGAAPASGAPTAPGGPATPGASAGPAAPAAPAAPSAPATPKAPTPPAGFTPTATPYGSNAHTGSVGFTPAATPSATASFPTVAPSGAAPAKPASAEASSTGAFGTAAAPAAPVAPASPASAAPAAPAAPAEPAKPAPSAVPDASVTQLLQPVGSDSAPAGTAIVFSDGSWVCPACGARNKSGSFCANCGSKRD